MAKLLKMYSLIVWIRTTASVTSKALTSPNVDARSEIEKTKQKKHNHKNTHTHVQIKRTQEGCKVQTY